MAKEIIVICEQDESGIRPVTAEVIAFANMLSKRTDLPTSALVIDSENMVSVPAPDGCDRIIRVTVSGRCDFSPEMYLSVLSKSLKTLDPAYVCIANTQAGIDFAPGIAARMNGACITGIEDMGHSKKGPWFGRQVLSGKKIAHIRPVKLPATLTVAAGAFQTKPLTQKPSRPEIALTAEYRPVYQEVTENVEDLVPPASLTDAEVIIAAGNGIGKQENLVLIHELAALFSRSAVAGSRPVCDRGWLPYNRQVGETGASVRPRLYIACGISGSSQHIAGMRASEFVVAVNTDAKAPICRAADICVIEDLNVFLPELIRALKEQKGLDTEEKTC